MTTAQKERIAAHGLRLQSIFPACRNMDPVDLCRRLRRLEMEGHRLGITLCDGPPMTEDRVDEACASILKRVDAILGNMHRRIPIHVNRDPRGCALKVDDEIMRLRNLDLPRDFGGYGLIAPEID